MPEIRLDLGSGKGLNTPEGFTKVDLHAHKGVKVVDLRNRWPWKANSVTEARAIYLLQYLRPDERIHFVNELYRVLKPGGTCEIHTPHWAAAKAYGDLDAKFPPVAEWWYPVLDKDWREAQNYVIEGYKCHFSAGIGYGMHPEIVTRNSEYQQTAMKFWKEAAQELVVTLTKV